MGKVSFENKTIALMVDLATKSQKSDGWFLAKDTPELRNDIKSIMRQIVDLYEHPLELKIAVNQLFAKIEEFQPQLDKANSIKSLADFISKSASEKSIDLGSMLKNRKSFSAMIQELKNKIKDNG